MILSNNTEFCTNVVVFFASPRRFDSVEEWGRGTKGMEFERLQNTDGDMHLVMGAETRSKFLNSSVRNSDPPLG
jgi:hypothetical protein